MDRRIDTDRSAKDRDRVGRSTDVSVLPSRQDARSACLRGLQQGRGPVLLTGEAGSGKTWLCKNLAESCPKLGRWLMLDAAPSDSGLDLLRRILRGLGRRDAASVLDARADLADELAEQAEDGRRWFLVLDEAQNASDSVLEEFRLLSNRLGQPDGLAGLVLVGRTSLVFRFRSRCWESLESRLAVHAQLGPIDAEEARLLLELSLPERSWNPDTIETIHARAAGNPARLLRLAGQLLPVVRPEAVRAVSSPSSQSISALDRESERHWSVSPRITAFDRKADPIADADPVTPCCDPPRLGEARPPLRFEDGVIEVGWADAEDAPVDTEPDPHAADDHSPADSLEPRDDSIAIEWPVSSDSVVSNPRPVQPSTVAIDDRYAEIQAQSQWSLALQAARASEDPSAGEMASQGPCDDSQHPCACEGLGETSENRDWSSDRSSTNVRAESGQEFAPYSRLFSQLNSANEPE
ncbi:AAA family ATPase [Tautonia rosea]|uniref:AAA family ATPase n=1 Tax=Tautonia rosea TaxID=2728037 RepID=UPI0014729FF4|nr:AAA family ATPase [Tautonia rosea]